jgi:hypothetical protein
MMSVRRFPEEVHTSNRCMRAERPLIPSSLPAVCRVVCVCGGACRVVCCVLCASEQVMHREEAGRPGGGSTHLWMAARAGSPRPSAPSPLVPASNRSGISGMLRCLRASRKRTPPNPLPHRTHSTHRAQIRVNTKRVAMEWRVWRAGLGYPPRGWQSSASNPWSVPGWPRLVFPLSYIRHPARRESISQSCACAAVCGVPIPGRRGRAWLCLGQNSIRARPSR